MKRTNRFFWDDWCLLQSEAADIAGGDDELPLRSSIEAKYRWRLEDMYMNDEDWRKDAELVKSQVEQVVAYEGRLGESGDTLLQVFQLSDAINERLTKLVVYARMRRDEDNTNATYQALTDSAMSMAVQASAAVAFVEPELLAVPENRLRQFVDETPGLQVYRFAVEELIRQKPHVLSASEEQLLAQAGEIGDAPHQIYTMFNNADLRFPKVQNDEGKEVELTHGRYGELLESRNRSVRQGAFEAMYGTYGKHQNTLAAVYSSSVKKDLFYARVRHYESARQAALFGDNVPLSVYDNLIEQVHQAIPALNEYVTLRKRVLKLPEIHMYDLYTPIVSNVDIKVPYDEAVETVKAAIGPLGEEYVKVAAEGMSGGWVDVFETRGKTSGAYSWGAYGTHPYILLNYQANLDNVFTLAHELGHAMHTYYSHREQPFVYASYTIFVAEVASTFNEALLLHHLLQTTTDASVRAYLLNHQLESIRRTVFRQTMFAEFEKLTHEYAEQGGALTPEWLSDTYYQLNQQYYGGECVVDKDIALEWSRIPHFYTPFYVYKYATGMSAATALSQRVLSKGQPAVADYLRFLQSGSSNYPIELLKIAGVDMASPAPVAATLQLFADCVKELSGLLA